MKRLLLLLLILPVSLLAQKHDNTWILGYPGNGAQYGHSILTFTEGSLLMDSSSLMTNYDFPHNNSAFSLRTGELFAFFNGHSVRDVTFEDMDNGDNMDEEIDIFSDYNLSDQYLAHGSVFIPYPNNPDSIILLYASKKLLTTPAGGVIDVASMDITAAIIDLNANSGNGKVIQRVIPIIHDTLQAAVLKVTKHANGRDWWLISHKWNSNEYYRILIDPKGIHHLSNAFVDFPIYSGAPAAALSPDGSKYATYRSISAWKGSYLDIFDFDRCTGFLANQIQISDRNGYGGLSFSSNSRFLYQNRLDTVFQYDMYATDITASRKVVAAYDGFVAPFPLTFYQMQSAPDGKIYASATNGAPYLHVIEYPDEEGTACQYRQHGLRLLKYNDFSVPNFPNYRLGPLDGSSCDTLGLDNLPVAWWRYVQDTLDALSVSFHDLSYYEPSSWSWDFGDGLQGSTERHPQHQYASPGVYEVCLTVSNVNATNTHCKTLYLGVSATENPVLQKQILVWPNPFRDYLSIALSANLRNPIFRLYDQTGRLLREEQTVYGATEIETIALPAGIYFWELSAAGERVKSGKLVKVDE